MPKPQPPTIFPAMTPTEARDATVAMTVPTVMLL